MTDFDDFLQANPAGPGQAVSSVEHLLRVGAASPGLLRYVSDRLEDDHQDAPTVACCIQLPWAVDAGSAPVKRRGRASWVEFQLERHPATIRSSPTGSLVLSTPWDAETAPGDLDLAIGFSITQIVAFVPLWNLRAKYYERYASLFTRTGPRNGIVVPGKRSWGRSGALTAPLFEVDIALRLKSELSYAISGIARQAAGAIGQGAGSTPLLGYFVVPHPSRVTFQEPPVPSLGFVKQQLSEVQAGLTVYFSTKLTPNARFLLDCMIFGTVGFERCEVVQFEQRESSATVRLQAADPADLVIVADALYERIWEMQDKAQTEALHRLDQVLHLNVMGAALSSMADKIDKMELRLPAEAAVERLDDLGDAHVLGKDKKSIETPGQTVVAAVWQGGKRAVGKAFSKLVGGRMLDALPLGEGDA